MRVWPLILRELREQSRRPLHYGLRAMGALCLLGATAFLLLRPVLRGIVVFGTPGATRPSPGWIEALTVVLRQYENRGGALFVAMNFVLLIAIWFLAPLLTADTLARERREGTLGLLLLTPLRPTDIVLAKLLVHGLRAAGVFFGALPILVLPVLLGGVSWLDVTRAALLDVGALVLALSAGLRASCMWQGPRAVTFGALFVAVLLGILWVGGWAAGRALFQGVVGGLPDVPGATWAQFIENLRRALTLGGMVWREPAALIWMGVAGGVASSPTQLVLPTALLVFALGLAAIEFAASSRLVRQAQREGRPRRLADATAHAFTRPWMPWRAWQTLRFGVLRWNPILWSELRTWRSRIVPWLMLLAVGGIAAHWFDGGLPRGLENATPWTVLTLATALVAASSFHFEHASGALELLLTTPHGARRTMLGKTAALAVQVLPAAALALGLDLWRIDLALEAQGFLEAKRAAGLFTILGWSGRLAFAGAAGLVCSLTIGRPFLAALATLVTLALGTTVASSIAERVVSLSMPDKAMAAPSPAEWMWISPGAAAGAIEALLALALTILLYRGLTRRRWISH